MIKLTNEKQKRNLKISLILNFIIIIMEVIAVIMSGRRHGVGLFQFYTEDSNLFALFACVVYAGYTLKCLKTKEKLPRWVSILKYVSVCCLTVTFVVVVCVLAPMAGGWKGYQVMLLEDSMLFHHFLCPVLAVISLLFFDGIEEIKFSDTRYALIPTALYAAAAVALNVGKVIVGPYPFLHVYEQPVFMSAIWCIVIVGGAYGIACLLRWLLKKTVKK